MDKLRLLSDQDDAVTEVPSQPPTAPNAGQYQKSRDEASAPPAEFMPAIAGYEAFGSGFRGVPPPPLGNQKQNPVSSPANNWNIPAVSEELAREVFTEFISSNCCYSTKPSEEMVFTDLHALNTYRYRLETFTESRTTKWASEPYNGQAVDSSSGVAPCLWDIVVPLPTLFHDSEKDIRIPHTSSLKDCDFCLGLGQSACNSCVKSGRIQCPECGGSGRTPSLEQSGGSERTASHEQSGGSGKTASHEQSGGSGKTASHEQSGGSGKTASHKQSGGSGKTASHGQSGGSGKTASHTQSGGSGKTASHEQSGGSGKTASHEQSGGSGKTASHEQCSHCTGHGKIKCKPCAGTGSITCKICKGNGQILTYKELKIKWKNNEHTSLVDKRPGFPIDLLCSATGQILFTDMNVQVQPVVSFPEVAVNSSSQSAVQEHRIRFSSTCRIIQQRQTIELIPVTRVHYTWNEKTYIYFVYGTENHVFADDYPVEYSCCYIL